jgi:hypothetical protein
MMGNSLQFAAGSWPNGKTINGSRRARRSWIVVALCVLHFEFCSLAHAAITQEEVFKSINENVSNSGEGSGRMFFAIMLGAVGVVMLLMLLSLRRKRLDTPIAVNHPGRLQKELGKKIALRPAELKQLKILAEGERRAGNAVENPLVFLLCPSVFVAAMRAGRVKVDRKVMAGLARKMGLVVVKK